MARSALLERWVTGLAFALLAAGCTSLGQRSKDFLGTKPDLMVVEWNEWKDSEHHTFSVQNAETEVMNQVRGWLAKVMPRQPHRNSTGAVVPRVKISFICFVDSEHKTVSEDFLVYRFKDSKSVVELVSESEISELLKMVK